VPRELKFIATPEKGEVSAILDQPANARALLVLGHGAGSNMRHSLIADLSDALVRQGMATFRYQYPYSEKGGGGLDGRKVLLATIRSAIEKAKEEAHDLPLLAGGHSMSGRMTTLAEADESLPIQGIVCFAFPINGGKGPDERAAHFPHISKPMLFHQGTKDKLADIEVMKQVVSTMKDRATLYIIDTADHGFKVLKRSGKTRGQVIEELAQTTAEWIDGM
jgi:predicted alpha/beta-hydrolase family hydrolase